MNNINLLPNSVKENISQAKKNRKAVFYFLKSLTILALLVIISGSLAIYFNKQSKNVIKEAEKKYEPIKTFGNLELEAKTLAKRLNTIQKINENINHWSPILQEIKTVMPNGSQLSLVAMDSEERSRGRLTGFADSKNIVAILRNAMEGSEKFEYVDIESSSIIIDQNNQMTIENFIITFSLTKDSLKEAKNE